MLDSSNDPELPVIHVITRVNSLYTYNHSVPTQPFCFSVSGQYSTGFKMGFMLHDLPDHRLNGSILSMFKVG